MMNDFLSCVIFCCPNERFPAETASNFQKFYCIFFQYYSITQSCPNSVKGWEDFLLGGIYQLKSKLA